MISYWCSVISIWFRIECYSFLAERYWFQSEFLVMSCRSSVISIWVRIDFYWLLFGCYCFNCAFLSMSYRFSVISILFRIECHWSRVGCYWFHKDFDFLSIFCTFHLISYRMLLISCRIDFTPISSWCLVDC